MSFLVPTPMIEVTYDNSSLEVGSSTVLNCTITYYSSTDIDILVNITWSRSGIVLSNDSDRVDISSLHESLSTSISQLTLSPLSAYDENITCSANVYLATPNSYIEMSPTVTKQVQLTIEGTTVSNIIIVPHYSWTLSVALFRA
jgi:translation initiation factor 6 (eIF-6)